MISDNLDRGILILLVTSGAALALGAVGIVDQPLAERLWYYLAMAGAAVPFLAVVIVDQVSRAKDAKVDRDSRAVEVELKREQTWALNISNEERAAKLRAPAVDLVRPVPYNTAGSADRSLPIAARRSARWSLWQKCALAFLDWVEIKHEATTAALVGPALMFSDRGIWVDATNGLRDAGLVAKANGAPTELVGTVDEARARVLAGDLRWPDDRDPPSYRPTLVELVPASAPGA